MNNLRSLALLFIRPSAHSFFMQAISCHYASSHCHYIDVRGTVQEEIAEEVLEVARKKLGNEVTFTFQVGFLV